MKLPEQAKYPFVTTKLPAIVLAAGLSTRMGDFKPLMRLAGVPLIERVIESLQASGSVDDIFVVTGHRGTDVAAAVGGRGVKVMFNENYAEGEMLSSVIAGIGALPEKALGFVLAF